MSLVNMFCIDLLLMITSIPLQHKGAKFIPIGPIGEREKKKNNNTREKSQ